VLVDRQRPARGRCGGRPGDLLSTVERSDGGVDAGGVRQGGQPAGVVGKLFAVAGRVEVHDGGAYRPVPFETEVEAEESFGACTIPSRLRAYWWAGTPRQFEFFQAMVAKG